MRTDYTYPRNTKKKKDNWKARKEERSLRSAGRLVYGSGWNWAWRKTGNNKENEDTGRKEGKFRLKALMRLKRSSSFLKHFLYAQIFLAPTGFACPISWNVSQLNIGEIRETKREGEEKKTRTQNRSINKQRSRV